MDEPPYHVDIRGLEEPDARSEDRPAQRQRPWVGILFECCGVYARVYRDRDGTAYRGRCPRCLQEVTLRVGPGGTDARFFTAQ